VNPSRQLQNTKKESGMMQIQRFNKKREGRAWKTRGSKGEEK
jgi:hypothetical protein